MIEQSVSSGAGHEWATGSRQFWRGGGAFSGDHETDISDARADAGQSRWVEGSLEAAGQPA